ncbi:hypothetical protein N7495_004940 [Penicillium taxi]|uniref:uncharacterized protein n=1 Tax=Penicillium taxi TaxID=168475 RepID=UPI002545B061|nr:uncharacterized protein N7495_004940 [Penicillium taxi]KAJ5893249.1 hypothetical protein N7495_004940 [Penicillium taxi]
MNRLLLWNPSSICELEPGPRGEGNKCCGVINAGISCKNFIKQKKLKEGRQKLHALAERPFSLSNLQPILRDIASEFLCTRWHRQRQADQVSQKWYQAAVRNQLNARTSQSLSPSTLRAEGHPLRQFTATQNIGMGRIRQSATSEELADQVQIPDLERLSFVYPTPVSAPSRSSVRSVDGNMLRENRVPWQVS